MGIGPSAFSTLGMTRWQNVPDFRSYSDSILSGQTAIGSTEQLTDGMKRAEAIALSLRTDQGVNTQLLDSAESKIAEFVRLGLMQRANKHFILTRAGKALADSIAAELV